MKQAIGLWCLDCAFLGCGPNDGGRTCRACLLEVILDNVNEVSQPKNYRKEVE